VPPPPVSGAAVGYAGAEVCVVGAGVAVWVGLGVVESDACGEPEDEAVVDELDARGALADEAAARDELDACGDPDADAPPDDLEPWPEGEGVRVPDCDEECPFVGAVGVKIVGTDEPPPVQAETAIAKRMAPAAERPAISHGPWAATGGVRRIFMNPPRMRVR
jgi:hypothetical protein